MQYVVFLRGNIKFNWGKRDNKFVYAGLATIILAKGSLTINGGYFGDWKEESDTGKGPRSH